MPLNFDQLIHHPGLRDALCEQARTFIGVYERSPRLASVFATQQRWLMGHLAMALYFRSAASGTKEPVIVMARFLEQVRQHQIASVNTADSFVKEMLVYGVGTLATSHDRRNRPIIPSPQTLEGIEFWLATYLRTLDRLDGGDRVGRFEANSQIINLLHPDIVESFVKEDIIRDPPQTFTLFTWLNNGGIVLDWLMAGVEPLQDDGTRFLTQLRSVPELAETFRLSRTHLVRKLREAETLGSLGWEGTRGRSRMWISSAFWQEYATAQIGKLRVVEQVCAKHGLSHTTPFFTGPNLTDM